VAFAKLYDRQTSLTAADLLNDQGVPFFAAHEVPLSRILTDRGTEHCGSPDSHEGEQYVASENIDPTRTKGKSPQTNGLVERFHKPRLKEFDRLPFRKKSYTPLTDLQTDFDEGSESTRRPGSIKGDGVMAAPPCKPSWIPCCWRRRSY
jgi:hypothetical protein